MAARVFSQAARPHQAALGAVDGPGPDAQAVRVRDQDPPRARRRRLRRRHRDRALRRQAGARAGPARRRLGAEPRAVGGAARCQGRRGPWPGARSALAAPARARGRAPAAPRSSRSAEAVEALGEVGWNFANPAPDVPLNVKIGSHRRFEWVRGDLAPVQADQGRARRHGQRRRARRRQRARCALAARARGAHRGHGAARAGPGLDPGRGRARPPRQQDRRGARPASGLRRGPGEAARDRAARRWRASRTPSRRSAPR